MATNNSNFALLVLLLSLLFTSCTNAIHQDKINIEKELKAGEKYFRPVVDLFTSGELNQVSTRFSQLSKHPGLTPVMKLHGFCFVYFTFERMDRFDSAILYQDSCIAVIEKNGLQKKMAHQYSQFLLDKSASLFKLHKPDEANEFFYKAKKLSEENLSLENKFQVIQKLGHIAYRQKNFLESLHSFKQLLLLQNQIDSLSFYKKAEIISNIGLCFFNMNQYDSAILVYKNAINLLDANAFHIEYMIDSSKSVKAYNTSKGVVLGNMAKVYTKIGNLDTAVLLSKQSITLNSTKYGERRDAQLVAVRLVDIYLSQKNWKEAALLLNHIQHSLASLPDENARMDWNRQKSAVLEACGELGKAYFYFKEYNRISDSIKNYQIKDAENNIIKDLQIKNQDADLSLLKKDNQLNRVYLWVTIGLIVMAAVIITMIFINYKKSKTTNNVLSKLNEAISQQKTALEKASADKDRVMNIVAHDLRNPIGGIVALSENIINATETDKEQQRQFISLINNTASHTLQLINELLNAQADNKISLIITPTNLVKLLENVILLSQHSVNEKKQILLFNRPKTDIIVLCDEKKIERVLQNILINAIKFTKDEGKIEINLYTKNECAKIEVTDNGIGIPPEKINNIFDMFTSAKRKGTSGEKSFGIGLSICKQIIEAHNGSIKVTSLEGVGSSFIIYLPIT